LWLLILSIAFPLFRFYRGGVRYKVVSIPSLETQCSSFAEASTATGSIIPYSLSADSINVLPNRSTLPTLAVRGTDIVQNGIVTKPELNTFTKMNNMQRFEHSVPSDLNNVLEFEVPYYSSIPISVVTEGTLTNIDGPLVRRNKIYLRRSQDPKGLDTPLSTYQDNVYGPLIRPKQTSNISIGGVTRATFGGAYVYQAAADDFSFGYLVGAPALIKIAYS
jgi:hypothetical protein